jgi:hypothetical protein
MICRHCNIEFDPKHFRHHRHGKIDECGDCIKGDQSKSIGVLVVDGKTDYHYEIIEKPSPAQCKLVEKAGKCGPTQCHSSLGLNTNGSSTPKDKIDSVQEFLEKESKEEKKRQQYKK